MDLFNGHHAFIGSNFGEHPEGAVPVPKNTYKDVLHPHHVRFLRIVHEYIKKHGEYGTAKEMAAVAGLSSSSGVVYLNELAKMGYVLKGKKRDRVVQKTITAMGLEILKESA